MQILKRWLSKNSLKTSLRLTFIAPFVLLILLVAASIITLSYYSGRMAVNDLVLQLEDEIAERIEGELDTYLEAPHHINRMNADLLRIGQLDIDDAHTLEIRFGHQIQQFESVSLISIGTEQGEYIEAQQLQPGQLRIATAGQASGGALEVWNVDEQGERTDLVSSRPNYDPRQRAWYTTAVEKGTPTWSSIYTLFADQQLAISANEPIYDRDGRLMAVASTSVTLSQVSQFFGDFESKHDGEIYIIDRDGLLIATSTEQPLVSVSDDDIEVRLAAIDSPNLLIQASAKYLEEFSNLTQLESSYQNTYEIDGERHFIQVVSYQDGHGLDWVVVIVIPESEFMAGIEDNMRRTVKLSMVGLLFVLGAGFVIANWIFNIRERTASKLAQTRQFLNDSINAMPNPFFVKDEQHRWLILNDAACDMFGHSREELIGKSDNDIFSKEDTDRFWEVDDRIFKQGGTVEVQENFSVGDQPLRTYLTRKTLVTDTDDRKVLVGVITDITKQLQLDAELQQVTALQTAILKGAGYALISTTPGGIITTFNPVAERILGYKAEEVIGKKGLILMHDPYELMERAEVFSKELGYIIEPSFELLIAKARRNLPNEYEWTYIRKDNTRLPVLLKVTLLYDANNNITGALSIAQDITERKEAEEALRESEERYRSVVEYAQSGIVILNERFQLAYVNSELCRIMGYEQEELIGADFRSLLDEESVQLVVKNYIRRQNNEDVPAQYEVSLVHKNGEKRDCEIRSSVFRTSTGNIRTIGQIIDITERKRAEVRLRQADNIIRNSPSVTFSWRNEAGWPVEFVSDNVIDLFGYTAESFLSGEVPYAEVLHPDDAERVGKEVGVYSQDDDCHNFAHDPYRIISKDGQIKWIDDRTHIVRDEAGEITHYQGVLLDISKLIKVEKDLRVKQQQAETLQTAVEALSSTLDLQRIFEIILNELGKVVPYDSASIQQIKGEQIEIVSCIGFSNIDEIIGMSFDLTDTSNPNCKVVQTNTPLILNGDADSGQYGSFFAGSWLGIPLLFGNNAIGMLTLDKKELNFYTEEHGRLAMAFAAQAAVAIDNARLFDETKQAKLEAIKASELKSIFLARVSHELRTPLGSILGYSELLHDGVLGLVSDKQKEVTEKIMDSSNYLASLVSDLLEHAQIESGNIELAMKLVNVNELLVNVQSKIDVLVIAKGLALNIHREAGVPAEFLGDERRVQQILINLLGNAVKFSNTGDIALRVKREGSQIIFEVEDSGIGIPLEAQAYIFDSFRQVKDSRIMQKQAGTGLGLPIAKQLAVAMGGDIIVESVIGQGSKFSVLLPIIQLPID